MSHEITLSEGQAMVRKFKAKKSAVHGHFKKYLGGAFNKDAILKLLNQPGCTGIRYYYGVNDQDQPVLVLVGIDATGKDLTGGPMLERCKLLSEDQAAGDLVK